MTSIQDRVEELLIHRHQLASLNAQDKATALHNIANALELNASSIFTANELDLGLATKEGLASALLKRLRFDQEKLAEVCTGLRVLAQMDNPVGKTILGTELDTGLHLYRVRCPIGTIAMIFESRPDALVQMAGLAFLSSNAIVLKGGREALNTNRLLAEIISKAVCDAGFEHPWLVLAVSREESMDLLKLNHAIDLIIPRGSNEFVQFIMQNTLIPVMGHADGICHAYIDSDFDEAMAINLIIDSKTQYVAVCNAIETILIHKDIASSFLPKLSQALHAKNVKIFGCEKTVALIHCDLVEEPRWKTEYLDYKVSIRIVDSQTHAMEHIREFGSKHTELICTKSKENAQIFLNQVDAASVFWNASTRFADGFRYGLGAEVGISTGKLHARGPVGIEGLMTYKYQLIGNGQIVSDYSGAAGKKYTHKEIPILKNGAQ